MPMYHLSEPKAARVIDRAISTAVHQVQSNSVLSDHNKAEFAYLIVRDKLEKMELDPTYEGMGVSDEMTVGAVKVEIANQIGVPGETLKLHYPDDLSDLARNGLALIS